MITSRDTYRVLLCRRHIAAAINGAMAADGWSKQQLANRAELAAKQVNRLVDADVRGELMLSTIVRAAYALELKIENVVW